MSLVPRHALLALATILATAATLHAQLPGPHVGYVYPAGAKQGSTVQVKVGGQSLDGAAGVYVSGTGITAKVIDFSRPITQKEVNMLRDKLKEMLEKKGLSTDGLGKGKGQGQAMFARANWTAEELKQIREIRLKIANSVKKTATPAIAQTVTVELAIGADTPPGTRELRLSTPLGLSNPLVFRIGTLPEFNKPAEKPQNDNPRLQKIQAKLGYQPAPAASRQEMQITLPTVVNGQIQPGGVDRYRFAARKGQQLLVAADARELIPYISDAVPGWFQAAISVRDTDGEELTYADHYLFHPDPMLRCVIPKDGDYLVEIHDSIYRGRDDFVYRVTVGDAALVAGACEGDSPIFVERKLGQSPNGDKLPECEEKEPNNDEATAQRVALPIIVKGRIDAPGDCDVFRFEGRAGQEIVAEVMARRLGSPLDSMLKLTDWSGRQIAFNDDHEDQGSGLLTHHADSYLMTTLPADGTYYLHLSDAQHKGGADFSYRLRISPPQPDFALRVVPSAVNARAGMNVPVTVCALRRDGFAGDIRLALKGAPAGFSLSGGLLPGKEDKVRVTLKVPAMPLDKPITLDLEGEAKIGPRDVRHAAVPADDMMQAFYYRHLVPAAEWLVAVTGRPRGGSGLTLLGASSVKLAPGGTAALRVGIPGGPIADRVQYVLSDPPEGVTIQEVSRGEDGTQIVLRADAAKVKKGTRGNLIIDALVERVGEAKNGKPANRRRVPLGSLPAVPFEIAGK
ncbi:MAG: hypothetical protein ABSG68_12945 [Thermoguttaceae bacterium]